MQLGAAWWFNDQKAGMEDHLRTLSSIGLLSRFVGMLTDSRSFLSFPRHEYFRRILCDMLGGWMEQGEIPRDLRLVGGMVEDICWNNAAAFFGIPEKAAAGRTTPRPGQLSRQIYMSFTILFRRPDNRAAGRSYDSLHGG